MGFFPFQHFGSSIQTGVLQQNVLEGAPFPVQMLKQVHGTEIVEVSTLGPDIQGDALMTQACELPLLIKTADCIPLVFADGATGWIAAVHAGWRGLTAEIVPLVLKRLKEKGATMVDLKLGIGPSLGVECAEFSRPFEEIPEKYHWAIREDKHVDLWAILERQLLDAGVAVENIEWMRVCTACNPEWFSWRRDADARRFGTFIVKKASVTLSP